MCGLHTVTQSLCDCVTVCLGSWLTAKGWVAGWHGCTGGRMGGRAAVWQCGSVAVWLGCLLAVWLCGCVVVWLYGWLCAWVAGWLSDRLTDRLTDWPTDRLTDRSTAQCVASDCSHKGLPLPL